MAWSQLEGYERMKCATEGCSARAVHRFESGGIGSVYCGVCRNKIDERKVKEEAMIKRLASQSPILNQAGCAPEED